MKAKRVGGGAQGENAIWAHRRYAFQQGIGTQGPGDSKFGGFEIGADVGQPTGFWVGDYVMEPENAGVGVIAHETGHDYGLPDEYDTSYVGEAPSTWWTIMSQGSYGGDGTDGIGNRPAPPRSPCCVRWARPVNKPRIFLGSSGKQEKLLKAVTRGLEDIAEVEPWTTTFNPGRSTLDRLVELSREVDFAAFVFAQDDWTTTDASQPGQASPRDNVVFEAGLFGGALGIRRTFILHATGSKLPSDLLGLTAVRYDPATSAAEVRAINQKLRKAIETEGRRGLVEGLWWQLSLTARSAEEPSAVSLLRIARDHDGALTVNGRSWQEDGTLSARYWSEAAKERRDPSGIFYFWKGERPRDPDAPQLEGTGELRLETADRATGYWVTRSDRDAALNIRTSGVYLRADPADLDVLDSGDANDRGELIAQRLREWKAAANAF